MIKAHLQLNRPVHLARRDVYFERAVDILYAPVQENGIASRLKHVDTVLNLLKKSEWHASLTAHSSQATRREQDFQRFLALIAQNVQSAHAMMSNQMHLEEAESFLWQFLGAGQEGRSLPALAYGRRADDILQGLWHVLRLGLAPYRMLQQENLEGMTELEKERYLVASKRLREELVEGQA